MTRIQILKTTNRENVKKQYSNQAATLTIHTEKKPQAEANRKPE